MGIVEQLRAGCSYAQQRGAANEIDRLRAELAEVIVSTARELGCFADNEAILAAISCLRAELAEAKAALEIAKGINAMRHELTDPGAQERRMERIADRMRDDKYKETLGTELSKALDLASKLEAANTRIAELEALVGDQKAATDEEFQNCSKIEAELAEANRIIESVTAEQYTMEAELAEAKARIAGLEAQLRHMHTFDGQHRARIAELEAYHTNCTDYINGLLGNMADDDKERVAILAAKDARIAELEKLEEDALQCASVEADLRREFRARAERAEAERDAMLAERNGLRALLALAVQWAGLNVPYRSHMPDWVIKARAILAPSPAGREG